MRKPSTYVLLSWGSGKDSALAFHLLKQQKDLRIAALFTTFNRSADRVAMHAVRRSFVEAQAEDRLTVTGGGPALALLQRRI